MIIKKPVVHQPQGAVFLVNLLYQIVVGDFLGYVIGGDVGDKLHIIIDKIKITEQMGVQDIHFLVPVRGFKKEGFRIVDAFDGIINNFREVITFLFGISLKFPQVQADEILKEGGLMAAGGMAQVTAHAGGHGRMDRLRDGIFLVPVDNTFIINPLDLNSPEVVDDLFQDGEVQVGFGRPIFRLAFCQVKAAALLVRIFDMAEKIADTGNWLVLKACLAVQCVIHLVGIQHGDNDKAPAGMFGKSGISRRDKIPEDQVYKRPEAAPLGKNFIRGCRFVAPACLLIPVQQQGEIGFQQLPEKLSPGTMAGRG